MDLTQDLLYTTSRFVYSKQLMILFLNKSCLEVWNSRVTKSSYEIELPTRIQKIKK